MTTEPSARKQAWDAFHADDKGSQDWDERVMRLVEAAVWETRLERELGDRRTVKEARGQLPAARTERREALAALIGSDGDY